MITNTEALRLAEALEAFATDTNSNNEAAAELRRLAALCAEWEAKAATWLASHEASQRLEGYRELGRMCAKLEAERDALVAEKRVTLRTIDAAADLLSRFIGRQTITSDEFGRVLDKLRAIQAYNLDAARKDHP